MVFPVGLLGVQRNSASGFSDSKNEKSVSSGAKFEAWSEKRATLAPKCAAAALYYENVGASSAIFFGRSASQYA